MRLPVLVLAFAGCGPDAESGRFELLRDSLLLPRCAGLGCHDLVGHKGNLTFEGPTAYANLLRPGPDGRAVTVPADNLAANHAGWVRVEPGDPAASFLVRKLEGPGPDEGEPMPRNSPRFEDDELQRVRQWIEDGAPE